MKNWMEGVTAVLETVGSLSASTQNISGRCYQLTLMGFLWTWLATDLPPEPG